MAGQAWRLEGWDTFAQESYRIPGEYPSEALALAAAYRQLEELERTQPRESSGGQTGIQDQIYVVGPAGQRYRVESSSSQGSVAESVMASSNAILGSSAMERTEVRTAFFHEDDYCQVEVLPAACADYCRSEMRRIDQFAESHREGHLFSDVYISGESPMPLAALRINLAGMRTAVEPFLPPFDQVLTGYFFHRQPCRSTVGWGEADSALFARVGECGVVEAVWLSLYGIPSERLKHWCRALRALPRAMELLVADWRSNTVVLLADESALLAYLEGHYAEPNTPPDRGRI